MRTTISGLKINYETLGEGQPIILLHGWGGSLKSLKALGSRLEGHGGLKMVLIDLPGFGKSDRPKEDGFSLDDYAEIIEEFLKQQNVVEPILFGHSFGGAVSIKIAIRKNVKVKKLILCNSSGIRNVKGQSLKFKTQILGVIKSIFSLPFLRNIYPALRKFFYYYILRNRDYIDHQEIAGTFKKVIAEDLTGELEQINVLTLLLWGENDKETPIEHGEIMKLKIQNSKLKVYPDESHGLPKLSPEKIVGEISAFVVEK